MFCLCICVLLLFYFISGLEDFVCVFLNNGSKILDLRSEVLNTVPDY